MSTGITKLLVIGVLVIFIGFSGFNMSGMSVSLAVNGTFENTVLTDSGIVLSGLSGNYISGIVGGEVPRYWSVFRSRVDQPSCSNTLVLTPSEDTYINEDKEDKSFAYSNDLEIRNTSSRKIAYIRFPSFSAPSAASASLLLSLKKTGDYLDIYLAPAGWNENSTWEEKSAGNEWEEYYNDLGYVGSLQVDEERYYEFNLTGELSLYGDSLVGSFSFLSSPGIVIAAGKKESKLDSSESDSPPKLQISYESACTSVKSQLRFCDSSELSPSGDCQSAEFVGPDGTPDTYYNSSEFSVNKWSRYVQQIFYLSSSSENVVPSLQSAEADFTYAGIEINYSFSLANMSFNATASASDSTGYGLSGNISWSSDPAAIGVTGSSVSTELSPGNYTIFLSVSYSSMSAAKNFSFEVLSLPESEGQDNASSEPVSNETSSETVPDNPASSEPVNGNSPSALPNEPENETAAMPQAEPIEQSENVIQEPVSSRSFFASSDGRISISDSLIPITEIISKAGSDASNARLDVSIANNPPEAPDAEVFSFIQIESQAGWGAGDTEIEFVVDKVWLKKKRASIHDIVMMRYHGSAWQLLETLPIRENSSSVTYRSVTPGFSVFAIAAKPKPAAWEKPSDDSLLPPTDIVFLEKEKHVQTIFNQSAGSSISSALVALVVIIVISFVLHHKSVSKNRMKSHSRKRRPRKHRPQSITR